MLKKHVVVDGSKNQNIACTCAREETFVTLRKKNTLHLKLYAYR